MIVRSVSLQFKFLVLLILVHQVNCDHDGLARNESIDNLVQNELKKVPDLSAHLEKTCTSRDDEDGEYSKYEICRCEQTGPLYTVFKKYEFGVNTYNVDSDDILDCFEIFKEKIHGIIKVQYDDEHEVEDEEAAERYRLAQEKLTKKLEKKNKRQLEKTKRQQERQEEKDEGILGKSMQNDAGVEDVECEEEDVECLAQEANRLAFIKEWEKKRSEKLKRRQLRTCKSEADRRRWAGKRSHCCYGGHFRGQNKIFHAEDENWEPPTYTPPRPHATINTDAFEEVFESKGFGAPAHPLAGFPPPNLDNTWFGAMLGNKNNPEKTSKNPLMMMVEKNIKQDNVFQESAIGVSDTEEPEEQEMKSRAAAATPSMHWHVCVGGKINTFHTRMEFNCNRSKRRIIEYVNKINVKHRRTYHTFHDMIIMHEKKFEKDKYEYDSENQIIINTPYTFECRHGNFVIQPPDEEGEILTEKYVDWVCTGDRKTTPTRLPPCVPDEDDHDHEEHYMDLPDDFDGSLEGVSAGFNFDPKQMGDIDVSDMMSHTEFQELRDQRKGPKKKYDKYHAMVKKYKNPDPKDKKDNDITERILGGHVVTLKGKYPWQGLLYMFAHSKDGSFCGCVAISESVIITAAHCIEQGSLDTMYGITHAYLVVGTNIRPRKDTPEHLAGQKFRLSTCDSHGEFHNVGPIMVNDIAYCTVMGKMDFRDTDKIVAPACLPSTAKIDYNADCYVTGYGTMVDQGTVLSNRLLAVQVPLVPENVCQRGYGSRITYKHHMCAGVAGKDSCQGDSGGPLVCEVKAEKLTEWQEHNCNVHYNEVGERVASFLAGIISFGKGCGRDLFPGVYVNIHQFKVRQWIDSIIKTKNNGPSEFSKQVPDTDPNAPKAPKKHQGMTLAQIRYQQYIYYIATLRRRQIQMAKKRKRAERNGKRKRRPSKKRG